MMIWRLAIWRLTVDGRLVMAIDWRLPTSIAIWPTPGAARGERGVAPPPLLQSSITFNNQQQSPINSQQSITKSPFAKSTMQATRPPFH